MKLLKAIIKSFKFTKYRWASIEFKDGSILVGCVTEDIWKGIKKEAGLEL